jgi:hypothetical protein
METIRAYERATDARLNPVKTKVIPIQQNPYAVFPTQMTQIHWHAGKVNTAKLDNNDDLSKTPSPRNVHAGSVSETKNKDGAQVSALQIMVFGLGVPVTNKPLPTTNNGDHLVYIAWGNLSRTDIHLVS